MTVAGPVTLDFVRDVLREYSERADCTDALYWRVYGDEIRLLAQCSDTFYWGTADCEQIDPEDLPLLRQCVDDLIKADAEYYVSELFAARKRGMRPQRPVLRKMPKDVLRLFLKAGPRRDRKTEG